MVWLFLLAFPSPNQSIKQEGIAYPEAGGIRDPDWQIRKHGEGAIPLCFPERQVVAYLVDSEEQILVCGCADDVCCAPETEGPEGCVL